MNFAIDLKRIKTRELIEAQDSLLATIRIMARFMTDDDGQPLDETEATETLLDMDLETQGQVQEAFLATFARLRASGRR